MIIIFILLIVIILLNQEKTVCDLYLIDTEGAQYKRVVLSVINKPLATPLFDRY